jgi:hypothetical protein
LACEAFKDFVIDSVTLSGPELRGEVTGKGEVREYEEKLAVLGKCGITRVSTIEKGTEDTF